MDRLRYVFAVLMLVTVPISLGLWLVIHPLARVVLLEERELRNRFGPSYDEYCRRVPRDLPSRSHAAHGTPGPDV